MNRWLVISIIVIAVVVSVCAYATWSYVDSHEWVTIHSPVARVYNQTDREVVDHKMVYKLMPTSVDGELKLRYRWVSEPVYGDVLHYYVQLKDGHTERITLDQYHSLHKGDSYGYQAYVLKEGR